MSGCGLSPACWRARRWRPSAPISRKTGYKIFERDQNVGIRGLTDRSRRPYRHANQLPAAVEQLIVRLKKDYPHWGTPKLRERLQKKWPTVTCPAVSTVHAVLDRHGLVKRRRRRVRSRLTGTPLTHPVAPNRLWCADYKGEFLLSNRRSCYPLTITDFASRYLIACEAQSSTSERYAFAVFERAFQDFGLPEAIRTDNVPFASAHALYGLSKLAVWWLRLGIGLERTAPGRPEQNGRHERLHLTLKTEATHPAAPTILQQQARFDSFLQRFNDERPHQALAMKPRPVSTAPRPAPTGGSRSSTIHSTTGRRSSPPAAASAPSAARSTSARSSRDRKVGIRQVDEHLWLVTFIDYDLGYFDDETCRLEPIDNPFGPKLLPMSPE
jgi:putative transposase